jgi:hypothetical protein
MDLRWKIYFGNYIPVTFPDILHFKTPHGMIHFYLENMATIQNRQQATAWQTKHDTHAPKVGDLAPDFELRDTHGENPLQLSEFQGKTPVALIFGSFT